MKTHLLALCATLLLTATCVQAQPTPFEQSDSLRTATHDEVVAWYQKLAKTYPKQARLYETGYDDAGRPIHAFVLSTAGVLTPEAAQKAGLPVVLINNAIHPGEPEGVDASMMLTRDILTQPGLKPLAERTVLVFIPMYNVSGALNQSRTHRANQNGPEVHGFRGNARNLDLNRDFIKADSRNARAFITLFQQWKPHLFIDNHTSNGADYAHVLTLLFTQRDKLTPVLGQWLNTRFRPGVYNRVAAAGFPACPYMNTVAEIPDSGLVEFYDSPRYSSGYAALFNCVGLVTETHMLKPFPQRVMATYRMMQAVLEVAREDGSVLVANKKAADAQVAQQRVHYLGWQNDMTYWEPFRFSGYEARYKPSAVSGLERLYYDRSRPWVRDIRYYTRSMPTDSATAPAYYVVPQAWRQVVELLKLSGVQMRQVPADGQVETDVYYLDRYNTLQRAYEGHYIHYQTRTRTQRMTVQVFKGDWVIPVAQPAARYIVETLEPRAYDSFFNWNFFDGVLGQKEYFSSYVFEDVAAKLLADNPALRQELEAKRAQDSTFARSANQQLDFVYKRSAYYEPSHNRYPVYRLDALPKGW